jgi:hypothetical protein
MKAAILNCARPTSPSRYGAADSAPFLTYSFPKPRRQIVYFGPLRDTGKAPGSFGIAVQKLFLLPDEVSQYSKLQMITHRANVYVAAVR